MKKYIMNIQKILLFAMIIIVNLSCEDYLDRTPIDKLDPDNFFRNEAELKSATFGMYTFLNDRYYVEMNHFTDDSYGFKHATAVSFTYGEHTAFDNTFLEAWRTSYRGIGQANLVLTYVDGSPVDEDVKNACKGEAYFMRAFYYWELTFRFGDVPLIISQPSVTGDIFPERTPRAEVIDQIIDDLDNAIEILPVDSDKGRVTKGAALGLKARVLLFIKDYSGVVTAGEQVFALNKYSLYPDYMRMFWAENEDNGETMFSIQYLEVIRGNGYYQRIVNGSQYTTTLSLTNEYETIDGDLITDPGANYDPQDPYANRDPRLYATILGPGLLKYIREGDSIFYEPTDKAASGIRMNKYNKHDEDYSFYDGSDLIMMRYAEVLLMYAEALNLSVGPTEDVYNAINEIRTRAGMPDLPAGLSQLEMDDRIRHERRVELAMEGHRLYDIVRWDIGPEAFQPAWGWNRSKLTDMTDPAKWVFEPVEFDSNRSFNEAKGYLWPIPGAEMELNTNLVPNPGYN